MNLDVTSELSHSRFIIYPKSAGIKLLFWKHIRVLSLELPQTTFSNLASPRWLCIPWAENAAISAFEPLSNLFQYHGRVILSDMKKRYKQAKTSRGLMKWKQSEKTCKQLYRLRIDGFLELIQCHSIQTLINYLTRVIKVLSELF